MNRKICVCVCINVSVPSLLVCQFVFAPCVSRSSPLLGFLFCCCCSNCYFWEYLQWLFLCLCLFCLPLDLFSMLDCASATLHAFLFFLTHVWPVKGHELFSATMSSGDQMGQESLVSEIIWFLDIISHSVVLRSLNFWPLWGVDTCLYISYCVHHLFSV